MYYKQCTTNLKRIVMGIRWKPQVSINNEYRIFKTYAEVKRNMVSLLNESNENEVNVLRSRRGEWGEWFEYWAMSNGKPTIIREGWS